MKSFDLSPYKLNCYIKNQNLCLSRTFVSEIKQLAVILFFVILGITFLFFLEYPGNIFSLIWFSIALLITSQMFLKITFSKVYLRKNLTKIFYNNIQKYELENKLGKDGRSTDIKLIVIMKNGTQKELYYLRKLTECNLSEMEEFVCFLNRNYLK